MSDKITTETREHVRLIGLNRPEARNRVDTDMIRGLSQAYTELSENDELWCGLVFAHGADFTFGLDLPEVAPQMMANGIADFLGEGMIDPWAMVTQRCRKPVVVAIQGRCFTAGLELALAADVVVAERGTTFGQMEVSRGIFPFGGATVRMPRVFGWHNAMRYMLTGDLFDVTEAHRMGLVSEIVDPGEALDAGLEMAQRIARQAPLGVQAALANAVLGAEEGRAAAAEQLLPEARRLFASSDAQEGIMSLLERRPARFTGK